MSEIDIRWPDGTQVRHKIDGYTGVVEGITRLKEVFTGNTTCPWQYRIKVSNDTIRRIAPQEDLEVDYKLYHFTDSRNLDSIRARGLLSWHRLVQENIAHIPASNHLSRSLDQKKNLHDYVRLCKNPYHPMLTAASLERRVERIAWLKINWKVTALPGVLFSDRNATANAANIGTDLQIASQSDDRQAEILVPAGIGVQYIVFPAS